MRTERRLDRDFRKRRPFAMSVGYDDYERQTPKGGYTEERTLPNADTSIAHLLPLRADEPAFLAAANVTAHRRLLRNGDWQGRSGATPAGVFRVASPLEEASSMPEHAHSWYFTLAPARWSASCACGLAVTVTESAPGRASWDWTLHGEVPPADLMLDGLGSVTRARRALLAGMAAGRN